MGVFGRFRWKSGAALCCVIACGVTVLCRAEGLGDERSAPRSAGVIDSSERLLELGKVTYEEKCVACHGVGGRGDGEAAYLLYPKPRDFVSALYRLVSTWDRIPTDEDLYFTISRGMPGSSMPSWGHLPEETRWGLVRYLKSMSELPLTIEPPSEPSGDGDLGTGVVTVPSEPPNTPEARRHGAELFETKGCADCHGLTGKGDGTEEQIDSAGYPTRPRNLTRGVYKGSPDGESVFRRIVVGMPGTPMPMNDWAYGEDAWALAHYVLEMSSERNRARQEMIKLDIVATRVSELPSHPDSSIWRATPPSALHLAPLWWRDDRTEVLTVRALHDGEEIALLLDWTDDTHDHTAIRVQDFRDAAAVQFSLTPDPPFFAMGERGKFVNIWMWKSERQADLEPHFQDLEKVYPNITVDSYANLLRPRPGQPDGRMLTIESDPIFVTGWGAGNIVSNPTLKRPVEDLRAQGFGTLGVRPRVDRSVEAKGVYRINGYRVIFRRALKSRGKDTVTLRPGTTTPIAFALWNGAGGDRDGKKSVTIWQDLTIAP